MSAIDSIRAQGGTRPSGLISWIMATVSEWNDIRVTRNALNRLSNRELDDIGLTRGDINRVAMRR